MTTYTRDSPSPDYEPLLYDAQGESWTRSGRDGFWRHNQSGAEHSWQFLLPAWFPFTTEYPDDPTSGDVTPEIRSQALGHAIAAQAGIYAHHGALPEGCRTLYELADQYARYIATGEHPK